MAVAAGDSFARSLGCVICASSEQQGLRRTSLGLKRSSRIADRSISLSSGRLATSSNRGLARAAAEVSESIAGSSSPKLDVLIESDAGQTYEVLQERLASGQWEEADKETRRLLCVLAGEGAAKRKWVYFTEVQFIPQKDIITIDRLWRAYSNDRFGYSVQRRIWKALGRNWKPFFLKIEWTYGDNSTYKKFPLEFSWEADAPVGHLPLTSCLRGTKLLENLLLHPAFAVFDDEQIMPDDSKLPDYSKAPSGDSSSADASPVPKPGYTGSVFDEDFNSADYGF